MVSTHCPLHISQGRFSINLPDEAPVSLGGNNIALSPDGTRLAYVTQKEGVVSLYTRELNQFEAEPTRGTEGVRVPFFSPDGECQPASGPLPSTRFGYHQH